MSRRLLNPITHTHYLMRTMYDQHDTSLTLYVLWSGVNKGTLGDQTTYQFDLKNGCHNTRLR